MKKHDLEIIKQTLSVLIGQPLRKIDRAGTFVRVNFGDLVEDWCFCKDENGKLVRGEDGKLIREKILSGRYALDPVCSVRLTCGDKVILSDSIIQLPNSQLQGNPDFDWDTFDWNVYGNNAFDEMVSKYVGDEPFEFVVKKVIVSKFGDLTITFANGLILELFANGTDDDANWRFYDIKSSDEACNLVVVANGIEKNDETEGA